MNFARCLCFLESNVYLKSFGLHVAFKTEEQFYNCYGKTLSEMGCNDLRPVVDEVEKYLNLIFNFFKFNFAYIVSIQDKSGTRKAEKNTSRFH